MRFLVHASSPRLLVRLSDVCQKLEYWNPGVVVSANNYNFNIQKSEHFRVGVDTSIQVDQ